MWTCVWTCVSTADGTLKSRLVLLGHLMPKDDELDISSPTPRLSSVRILLALAIKLDLVCEIVDIDTAFTYAMPHTTIYASIPGGLYDDDRLGGKYLHLLRNLYGAGRFFLFFMLRVHKCNKRWHHTHRRVITMDTTGARRHGTRGVGHDYVHVHVCQ